MAAVLLRMAGLDALDADAEAQPPDRKSTQAVKGVRTGERGPVVSANGFGQPELFENTLENREGTGGFGGLLGFAAEQVS